MTNFIIDQTPLPIDKININTLPPGANPRQWIIATEWIVAMQAVLDVRDFIRGAPWLGMAPNAADPVPTGVAKYLWLKSDGVLWKTIDAVASPVGSSSSAVIFDDVVPANEANIRSDRATDQSAIDNTEVGITNFGSQDGSWNGLAVGVTASWGTIGGGVDNEVTNQNAVVAGGAGNSATGYTSAVAGGYLNVASGEVSFAVGGGNVASGEGSAAIGVDNQATDLYAFAAGLDNLASGFASAALCSNNTTSGDYAFASGSNNVASGNYSSTRGSNCTASGDFSHAEGNSCDALGDYSHAEGDGTEADGLYSHAEGSGSATTDDYAHAQNFNTSAARGGHAEGDSCSTTNDFAHAEGRLSVAGGKRSHAQGVQAVTSREAQDTMAAGAFSVAGDAQASGLVLRGTTPGAGAGESVVLRYGAAFDQDFTLANSRSYTMVVTAIAQGTTPQQLQSFKQMFAVRVDNLGVATMAALGTAEQIGDVAAASWTLTGTVIAGPQFRLTFNTGATTEATRVVAKVDFVEVLFP
jgi:hypothetical protein